MKTRQPCSQKRCRNRQPTNLVTYLNELYVQGQTYQLSQQRQTNSVPSITYNSRKCRAVKRGKGQAEGDTKPDVLKTTHSSKYQPSSEARRKRSGVSFKFVNPHGTMPLTTETTTHGGNRTHCTRRGNGLGHPARSVNAPPGVGLRNVGY